MNEASNNVLNQKFSISNPKNLALAIQELNKLSLIEL